MMKRSRASRLDQVRTLAHPPLPCNDCCLRFTPCPPAICRVSTPSPCRYSCDLEGSTRWGASCGSCVRASFGNRCRWCQVGLSAPDAHSPGTVSVHSGAYSIVPAALVLLLPSVARMWSVCVAFGPLFAVLHLLWRSITATNVLAYTCAMCVALGMECGCRGEAQMGRNSI